LHLIITVIVMFINVDDTHGSQPLDLSILRSRDLLPTSDSRAPLISALLSHMSIKALRASGLLPIYSLCA